MQAAGGGQIAGSQPQKSPPVEGGRFVFQLPEIIRWWA
jgi:hypothetical protein